jgi:hypothetical protein
LKPTIQQPQPQIQIQTKTDSIADETTDVKADEYQYYSFDVPVGARNIKLTGNYQEQDGRDVTITLYDKSTCKSSDSSKKFDIMDCNDVFIRPILLVL